MNVLNFLATMPGLGHTTVTKDELRELLTQTGGQMMAQGSLWEIVSKHLGAEVYRVTTKRWEGAV